MIQKESKEITSLGVGCIFFSSLFAIFLGMGSYLMYQKSGSDSYISAFIGGAISLIIFAIFYYIFSRNPKEDFYSLSKFLFGNVFGNIINIVVFIAIIIIATFILYNISSFLNHEYLPESSENFIRALMLVTIVYVTSKSLPEIIKVNQIFTFINVIINIVDIIGLYYLVDISNIEPVFSSGSSNIFYSIKIYVILSIVAYFMLLITSKRCIKDSENSNKTIIKSVLISNIMLVLIFLFTILILGKDLIGLFRYPEYIALKRFKLFGVIERVENILALPLFYNTFSMLMFLVYYIINFIPKTRFKNYYPVIVALVLYVLTGIIFKNSMSFITIMQNYLIYVVLIGIMLPVIVIFLKLLKYAKKTKNI